jgi:hypothetical protein
MATAVKKRSSKNPLPTSGPDAPLASIPILRFFDNTYRFLASLKLAVFSLSTLAAVLAYATFFESWYGTHAVQEWIYRSKAFALLLAFLGINIFCAALIRFRWDEQQKGWTRRQTGFVITHVGLLVVLFGSWVTLNTADEGQVALREGESTSTMIRPDHTMFRITSIDPKTGEPAGDREWEIPFRSSAFSWDSTENANRYALRPKVHDVPLTWNTKAAIASVMAAIAGMLFLAARFVPVGSARSRKVAVTGMQVALGVCMIFLGFYFTYPTGVARQEALAGPKDPFRLIVKDYIAASSKPRWIHVPGQAGPRKIKVAFEVQPPAVPMFLDVFQSDDRQRWLEITQPRLDFVSLPLNPATITFGHVDTADKLDDFLHPPKDPLNDRQARFHYVEKTGKTRVFEWTVDEQQKDKPFVLPDSDLTVTLDQLGDLPGNHQGDEPYRMATFKVRKGDGPDILHYAMAGMPMVPNVIPTQDGKAPPKPLVRITYYYPPDISREAMGMNAGVINILVTDSGSLYYRAFTRHGMHGPGPLALGKEISPFGPASPMKAKFRVDEYHESGGLEKTYLPIDLPSNQADSALSACLLEMQVGNDRKTFWVRRPEFTNDHGEDVELDGKHYRIAYDVDRRPLGFEMTLANFDLGTDPGSQEASSYASDVVLNDAEKGVKDKPVKIYMNNPLYYRGQTFYQSQFQALQDPRSGRKTGDKRSVFQVGIDPFWGVKYLGCLFVFMGIFLQFYMRAGVFTDGGKKERERLALKEHQRSRTGSQPPDANGSKQVIADFEEL